jgi:hypothetical protein
MEVEAKPSSDCEQENPRAMLPLSAKTEQKRVQKSCDEILNGKIKNLR